MLLEVEVALVVEVVAVAGSEEIVVVVVVEEVVGVCYSYCVSSIMADKQHSE